MSGFIAWPLLPMTFDVATRYGLWEGQFEPFATIVVDPRKAKQLGAEMVIGIEPADLFLLEHPCEVVIPNRRQLCVICLAKQICEWPTLVHEFQDILDRYTTKMGEVRGDPVRIFDQLRATVE